MLVAVGFGVLGFSLAIGGSIRTVRHVMEGIFRDEARVDTVEQWVKYARQDIAGVLTALQVTNGLLGAIVGLLIFRAVQ
jgi:hypothetical protein